MSMSFYCYFVNDAGSATFSDGPNFSNSNCAMILRSLDYEVNESSFALNAKELLARVTLARVVSPVEDDGMPNVSHGNWTECGVRPGYFKDAYEAIAEVCQTAIDWGVEEVCVA